MTMVYFRNIIKLNPSMRLKKSKYNQRETQIIRRFMFKMWPRFQDVKKNIV